MQAFNVYLNKRLIDTVFYDKNAIVSVDDVYNSLVNHDGYDSRIVVRKARW